MCVHAWEHVDHRETRGDPDRIPWPPGARLATPNGRPRELVVFCVKEWCSGCGALLTQCFSASAPDVPRNETLRLPSAGRAAPGPEGSV